MTGPTRRGGPRFRAILGASLLAALKVSVATVLAVRPSAQPPAAAVPAATASAEVVTGQTIVAVDYSNVIERVAAETKPSAVTITSEGSAGFTLFSVPSTGVGSASS